MGGKRDEDPSSHTNPEPKVALDILPLHSTDLLTAIDENGLVQYKSPAVQRILGFEEDELVGERIADYIHPDDRENVVSTFQTVITSDKSIVETVEYRHERADGTYKWVESVVSANPTPNGYYVVNTRDISDHKEREQELKATNDRLTEFASIVSHDLRNPLNVAQSRVELAQEECESKHLADVISAHDRMEMLIDDLLSQSQFGNQVKETEAVALSSLTETCWQTVPTADATLVIDTDQHLLADRSRLQQLLENLIRNAIEHGGETVTVTVGDLETGFYIEDDGDGIPLTDRSKIFEPGNSTTNTGTGLGLSIVKQIVDAHDWRIRYMDGESGGARFEITGVESI